MADVFLSYVRGDRPRVARLVATIRSAGHSVWWDDDITPGAPWEATIERELAAARVVVVCWSAAAVASENVRAEARRARAQDRLIQAYLEPCEPPLFFGERQGIELFADAGVDGAETRRLLRRLDDMLDDGGTRPPPARAAGPDASPRIGRRGLILGGGAALVAASGTANWLLSRRRLDPASASLAVMPFANLSGDPAQAYFSDGLAEELRSALGRLPGIKVIARTSSELLRNDDAVDAAKKLAVAHILIGSVRRSPSLIRISAQLIDGASGTERWSHSYDRPPGDALAIQSGIAENVAEELSVALGVQGREALAAGGTANAAAHDLYLKAERYAALATEENTRQTLALVDAALDLDPRYAAAHVLRARLLSQLGGAFAHTAAEATANYNGAAEAARRAIALAPGLPDGHVMLARILSEQLHVRAAAVEYQRAAALGTDANFLRGYGVFLLKIGRIDEAVALSRRAVALDPLNPRTTDNLASVLFGARRYAEAIDVANQALHLKPGLKDSEFTIGMSLLALKRYDEAKAALARMPDDDLYRLYAEAIIAAQTGRRAESDRLLAAVTRVGGDAVNYQLAEIYAQRGETDQAIAALDRAWTARDSGLLTIRMAPFLDPLRADPRFKALVAKLDLP